MRVQREMTATADDVQEYANLVGDHNPLHVSETHTERSDTFADTNIVHGALILGWFSGLLTEIADGGPLDGEIVLHDIDVSFHNALPVGTSAIVEAEIPFDDIPDDPGTEPLYFDVSLDARSRDGIHYAEGSAGITIDPSVGTYDHVR